MQKKLVWKNLVGQKRIKETLAAAFENNALGHAYLFSGPEGVGKFQAALELGRALLCLGEKEVPCYSCESCRQVSANSHPDFHCVFPVALSREHKRSGESSKLSEDGWCYIADETRKKIENPYVLAGSRLLHIPVEWIRELNQSIIRGTIQGKINIAIVCDVDVMQAASANAMLKTLEEPPPNTIMFLCTQRPHAVLPTIRSRCQVIRFGSIAAEDMTSALSRTTSLSSDDKNLVQAVARAGGSYGKALSLIEESLDEYAAQAHKLWELCINAASMCTVTAALETTTQEYLGGGYDYAAGEKLLVSFLHIIRSTFFKNIVGNEKYINVLPTGDFAVAVDVATADKLCAACEKAIAAVRARGNLLLVLCTFFMVLSEIIHGKSK